MQVRERWRRQLDSNLHSECAPARFFLICFLGSFQNPNVGSYPGVVVLCHRLWKTGRLSLLRLDRCRFGILVSFLGYGLAAYLERYFAHIFASTNPARTAWTG